MKLSVALCTSHNNTHCMTLWFGYIWLFLSPMRGSILWLSFLSSSFYFYLLVLSVKILCNSCIVWVNDKYINKEQVVESILTSPNIVEYFQLQSCGTDKDIWKFSLLWWQMEHQKKNLLLLTSNRYQSHFHYHTFANYRALWKVLVINCSLHYDFSLSPLNVFNFTVVVIYSNNSTAMKGTLPLDHKYETFRMSFHFR